MLLRRQVEKGWSKKPFDLSIAQLSVEMGADDKLQWVRAVGRR